MTEKKQEWSFSVNIPGLACLFQLRKHDLLLEKVRMMAMMNSEKNNHVKIDVSKIPKYQVKLLCHDILEGCKKFYSDPENVKKFKAWKGKRDTEFINEH